MFESAGVPMIRNSKNRLKRGRRGSPREERRLVATGATRGTDRLISSCPGRGNGFLRPYQGEIVCAFTFHGFHPWLHADAPHGANTNRQNPLRYPLNRLS